MSGPDDHAEAAREETRVQQIVMASNHSAHPCSINTRPPARFESSGDHPPYRCFFPLDPELAEQCDVIKPKLLDRARPQAHTKQNSIEGIN
jgi:hypothetical protein